MRPMQVSRCFVAISLSVAGCAIDDIERISRVHAECRHEARKLTESDQTLAHLEEACLERRRAEWAR